MPPLTSPPDRPSTTDAPIVRARRMPTLTGTWPGRAVLIGGLVKLTAIALSRAVGDSFLIDVVGTAGTLALLIGLAYFIGQLIGLAKRQLLWRVRRKLILSYVFVGLVPALLIITFCLLCGLLLFGTVSQYVVDTRLRSGVDQSQFLARSTAMEIGRLRSEEEAGTFLAAKQALLAERNPDASLAIVPVGRTCDLPGPVVPTGRLQPSRTITAGPWSHLEPPAVVPDWVPCGGFAGLVAYAIDAPAAPAEAAASGVRAGQPTYLVVRATAFAEGTSPHFAIVLDMPVNEYTARRLNEDSGVELRGITIAARGGAAPQRARPGARAIQLGDADEQSRFKPPFFVFTEFADWTSGRRGRATLSIGMNIGQIYTRPRPTQLGEGALDRWVVFVLIVFGVLFLIIEFFALVVGLSLAKSITGSVHELFVGTERVQQGDFSHRIDVKARDQLGALANSFNTMTSRLTQLLAEMAEKKRLEEELRIARGIQMSLLPQGPIGMPGLTMTANCTPAREVGGDYYDVLPIDDHRIGVLIADVSGKGTSAALYMAELKGLMLSLTQIHMSPRALMIAANKIIAANLDSRSFITMTYAIFDLEARTMTYARAGHTPLIHLPMHGVRRQARLLTTGGMVLGLKLDNGEKFAELLEEVTLPLETGDLFVLFTDGITEAMNASEELFGEDRLGALVEEHADLSCDELRERIYREVRAFAGEPGPHDDMTLILMRVEPSASATAAISVAEIAVV
jgi:sigma-B regulation protein RsbU (phosphoserine phosphatase)